MKTDIPLVLAGVLGLFFQPAFAQTAPGDPAGAEIIPEKDLSRPQDMVIKPKQNVDPAIVKPAPVPNPNSTPVIPPAGTPGGPPGPEPK
ncbi:MAG: hypothetical protein ACR2KT_05350 [Methylocella sp.]|nr:MAG: hypothetical protein DLM68_03230 [Hyphomicrobiales bacterium]